MNFLIQFAFSLILLLATFVFTAIKNLFREDTAGSWIFLFFSMICGILAIGVFGYTAVALTFWVCAL